MKKLCTASAALLLLLLSHSSAFAQAFFCPNSPRAISTGDFDDDNKLDIASLHQGSSSVFIHPGDGAGDLGSPTETPSGLVQPTSVVAGDFVGGGGLDLAVAGFRTTGVFSSVALSVLEGNGAGGFQRVQLLIFDPPSLPVRTLPTVSTGDFNGDGRQDLALVDGQTRVRTFLQNPNGGFPGSPSFSTPSVFSGPADAAVGEFNGDGALDFVVAKRSDSSFSLAPGRQVSPFFGNGAGGFTRQADIQTGGTGPQSVVAGDFNQDGFLDLAVLHFNSNDVSILLGNGGGDFSRAVESPLPLPAGNNGASLLAVDFDGDGNLDLVPATTGPNQDDSRVFVLFGDGGAGFPSGLEFNPGFPPRSSASGDFDGNGLPDLAASFFCGDDVTILLNPLPPPGKAMVYITNRESDTVSVIDPEIDQVIDSVPVGHKPHGVALTPDGKEAYVANRNDDSVSVIETGTSPGSNTEILAIPVGRKPVGVKSANVSSKGAKVFVANRNDDTISVIDADPASPSFHTVISTVVLPRPKNNKPVAVAFGPDGAFAYVAAKGSDRLLVVDASKAIDDPANAVVSSVTVGKKPTALEVSGDGKTIYVANRGDSTVSKLTTEAPGSPGSPLVIATIEVARHPGGVAVLPDGRVVVTSREANRIAIIDATGSVIASIPAGKHPLGLDTLPAGGFVYAAEEGDDSVAVIDTTTDSLVVTIPVGKHPQEVAAGIVPITDP